ncbi:MULTISPECIES: hypothetical protein [unclassified Thioclava]|uniref:hypothetical protein n=1 Tax=unclassified Thioclava TaxID=2621713 RepID=UPI0011B25B62|nr:MULTISPECIES: hypothetical protein [unclassified Thioclava]
MRLLSYLRRLMWPSVLLLVAAGLVFFDQVLERIRLWEAIAQRPATQGRFCPMSFLTMDDVNYFDGLIVIYELSNVALMHEIYIENYLASTEKYGV